MEIIFALITAIAFAFDSILIRKGLIKCPYPIVAAFITLTISSSFFVILSFMFVPLSLLRLKLVYFFIIAGILSPGFGRVLFYKGLQTLGVSISVPITSAESLFSVIMAIIFLEEPINFVIATGILSVVIGLILFGYETGRRSEGHISQKFRYRYLFFPVTASIFTGVSFFFRKLGLNVVNSPILGAAFTSGTAWCILLVFLTSSRNFTRLFELKRQGFVYFIIAGITTSIAWISFFCALNIGKIVIVAPITCSYPLMTLLLSYVLLQEIERIRFKIVGATIMIVGGIILLSLRV